MSKVVKGFMDTFHHAFGETTSGFALGGVDLMRGFQRVFL